MKITAYIFQKDRSVISLRVDPKQDFFMNGDEMYVLDQSCVFLSSYKGGLNPKPEIFYTQNNPLPVNSEQEVEIRMLDDKGNEITRMVDKTQIVLRQTVIDNFIKQTASITSEWLKFILGYLKDPKSLLMLALVVMIIYAYAGGEISNWLKNLRT